MIIAIDGPAGSGKSSVSRASGQPSGLGLERLDTGAMYRAVAWAALRDGIAPDDRPAVARLARGLTLEMGERVVADGTDVTEVIRGPEVSAAVSAVAANPDVREELVERQRQWAADHGGDAVVEGRDIGSVVFPAADLKIFLTAPAEVRAAPGAPRRRAEAVARRDRIDSTRAVSPLEVPDGALVIDSGGRTVEEIVEEVVGWL